MKKRGKRKFEKDFGFSLASRLLGHRESYADGRLKIPVISAVLVVAYAFLIIGMAAFSRTVLAKTWIHITITFVIVLLSSIFFTGGSGQAVLGWFGLVPSVLRKSDVPADNRPISLAITRAVVYSAFAFQIAFWIWWSVFNRRPLVYPEGITDKLVLSEIRNLHYLYQFELYLWVFVVLIPICILAVSRLEQLPVLNFVLRRTRLLILLVTLIGLWQVWMIFSWFDTTGIWPWPI